MNHHETGPSENSQYHFHAVANIHTVLKLNFVPIELGRADAVRDRR